MRRFSPFWKTCTGTSQRLAITLHVTFRKSMTKIPWATSSSTRRG
uniref:Alternative protein TBC1D21 n=1 Tax=Homo sapiens TaxID=9606 RepID=L0R6Q7_HUMAN|nr:alternative protein TBC1D21 [Homo sapiens]